ncbi:hypothetical protein MN608_09685 [Microdochium nivale]|nr:hypothetical protein MN608_09685 [Microdochium nivale]
MRSNIHALATLLVPLAAATIAAVPRLAVDKLAGRATCGPLAEVCEDDCMELGATCCNDGTSTYCDSGYYCTTTSCCRFGQVCPQSPLDPDVAASLSALLSYSSWSWDTLSTAGSHDSLTTSSATTTYSFSFDSQPTGPSGGGDGSAPMSTPPPSPPPLPIKAAGHSSSGSRAVVGLAVAAVALFI